MYQFFELERGHVCPAEQPRFVRVWRTQEAMTMVSVKADNKQNRKYYKAFNTKYVNHNACLTSDTGLQR